MTSPQYLPEPKSVIEVGKSFQSFSFRQLLQGQKCTETALQHQRDNLCPAAVLIFHNQERNKHSIRYSSRLINSFSPYIRTFLYQFSLKYQEIVSFTKNLAKFLHASNETLLFFGIEAPQTQHM